MLELTREQAEALLRRRLNRLQLKDLDKTGCFNVELKGGFGLLRVSTHDRMPPAIDEGGNCRNSWPYGAQRRGMHRALAILITVETNPSEFYEPACMEPWPTYHMCAKGQEVARAFSYRGKP